MGHIPENLLIIQAHPDDAEAWSAGTLALMAEKGWKITIATMTAGGMGSFSMKEEEAVKVRRNEAAAAAKEIGADYHCFNRRDGFLFDGEAIRIEVVNLIRKVNAGVVITHAPFDYHIDHRTTCTIVDAAVLIANLPNIPAEQAPLKLTPVFYHGMPFNLTDSMGDAVPEPHFFVDISGNPMDKKMAMLTHHKSQQDLMRQMMGMEDFFGEMKVFNSELGKMIDVEYAECYWQHLGGGYPRDTIIQDEISDFIHHRK
ncbi:MAG: PIG-L family deacetylase [Spirochaetaceae bacterium]|nr:PIG-L family deacetylase [Spirochaetaceae bacterium]